LPQGTSNSDSCYAVWSPEGAKAIGSSTQPVYIDATGQVVTCTAYTGLFTNFSSSTNTLSLTVGGTTKTATAVNSVSNTWTTNATTYKLSLTTTVNGVAGSAIEIPAASGTAYGVVSTGSQTFAGAKTFTGVVSITNTTASSSSTTGALKVSGGVGIAGALCVAGNTVLGNEYADSITINGKMKLVNNRTYGTTDPNSNTNLTNPTTGQVYFRLIS
jgi:hypothetical protein